MNLGGAVQRVLLAGGGTAGHVEPALATADALLRARPELGITFLGTASGLEARLVPARGYDLALIPRTPLPRRPTLAWLTLPRRLWATVSQTAAVLRRTGAGVVVGFGGYVALPAYVAARRRGIPIVVHEANVRPGLANRVGARLGATVATAVPGTGLRGAQLVGMPLRTAITTLAGLDSSARAEQAKVARVELGLPVQGQVLLVFGGSQGAARLNSAAAGAASQLVAAGVSVLHAVGKNGAAQFLGPAPDPDDVKSGAANSGDARSGDRPQAGATYVVVEYFDQMELAYAAADLVLCRAGMTTCAEVAAVGLPAAFVPLPHGNGEQRLNALPLVAAGGALMVDDGDVTSDWVTSVLLPLLSAPARLATMAAALSTQRAIDADDRLATLVLGVLDADSAPARQRS